ncbi:MAG TPA: TonB-dependent receptor [Myxococcales bacterium]|jgi:iron complex outermembrane receptor protein/hemoglobin/transferrin/lactoferrin receptor protein
MRAWTGEPAPLLVLALLLASPAAVRAEPRYETTVTGSSDDQEELAADAAASTVRRKDLDARVPRSAPDAVRYEAGVFVQQSAHAQGSAYLRGLTGQQTLLLFDGIRLNNSTYRQGPNQYFFTLDSRTLRSIEVERGGGSTRWGSDALGGVLDAHPVEPRAPGRNLALEPRLFGRIASADSEEGGRVQLDTSGTTAGGVGVGFVGGFGARRAGLLTGPPVLNPNGGTDAGELPAVPRYAEYDPLKPWSEQRGLRTQLGTGFKELTGDGRLVLRLPSRDEVTAAAYLYRQYDAPRTDQCPPPQAPWDQCLVYEEQFRHLAYLAWKRPAQGALESTRVTLSWQEQHEKRRLDLSAANLVGRGTDDVETFGLTARGKSIRLRPADSVGVRIEAGLDTYVDWLRSRAEHTYSDTLDTVVESRGQYLDGASYVYGGLYAEAAAELGPRVTLRGGARVSWISAHAPADPLSGTRGVDRAWVPVVGNLRAQVDPARWLALFVGYDHSYRAPNLDDLTSRQQTGPGFQFENPDLSPERAHTFEAGARVRTGWLSLEAWAFETLLDGAILKVPQSVAECPAQTPQCQSSWSRFRLENAPALSELRGAEGAVRLTLPAAIWLRASGSYVWSEGPRVGNVGDGVYGVVLGDRVPLSRTPPPNGTVELGWSHASGFSAGAALQWALAQDRLAVSDYSDGRIPKYGTPGFAVVHLRAGYRLGRDLSLALVLENLFDSPYRFHGSSVNGAGRGILLQLSAGRLAERTPVE